MKTEKRTPLKGFDENLFRYDGCLFLLQLLQFRNTERSTCACCNCHQNKHISAKGYHCFALHIETIWYPQDSGLKMAFHHHRTSFIKYRLHCGVQHGANASCFFHCWTVRFKIGYKLNRPLAYQTRARPVLPRGIVKIFRKELYCIWKTKYLAPWYFQTDREQWNAIERGKTEMVGENSTNFWLILGEGCDSSCTNRLVSSVVVCTFVLCYEHYTVRSKNVCHERGFSFGIKECRVELSKKICVWSVRNHRCCCSSIHVPSPRVE